MASDVLAVSKACGCAGRRLPIRIGRFTAALISGSSFRAESVVLTYRCQRCRVIVEITVADVRLVVKDAA